MSSVLTEIVIESANPQDTAEFWSEALGWELRTHQPGDVPWVSASGDPDQHDLKLVFIRGRSPERLRNHFYLNASGIEVEAELTRLRDLGAELLADSGPSSPVVRLRVPGGVALNLLADRID